MPTYEYICSDCNHRFEVFQQMSDSPLRKCPECAGAVQRLIGTGAGFIMKGKAAPAAIPCGNDTTCCGRATRCDEPSCEG